MQKQDITKRAEELKALAAQTRDAEARALASELDRLPREDLGDEELVTRSVTLAIQLQGRLAVN